MMSDATHQLEIFMKLTKNRLLILRLLDEDVDGSMPPHSVSTLHYTLEYLVKYKWQGYPELSKVPDKRNLNRTCVDLLNSGLIVVSRVKLDSLDDNLPFWEKQYQLATSVERNFIVKECNAIYRKVKTAKNGTNFFGTIFNIGLPVDEVEALDRKVRGMMQRTNPDKTDGYEHQFKLMNKAKGIIKSGIPLPDVVSNKKKKEVEIQNITNP